MIRFLKKGKGYHVVHDSVMGKSVMEYVKEQIYIEKTRLVIWIQNLVHQLDHYYQTGGGEAYGLMNPYSIIIADNDEVLLLDASAEENGIWLGKMRKKKIREVFVRKEHILAIKTDMRDDIYGLGQLIQFILRKCCPDEKYSIREQQIIKKVRKVCESSDIGAEEALKEVGKLCQKLTMKERKKAGMDLQMAAVVILVFGISSSVLWECYGIKDKEVENLQAKLDYVNEQKAEVDKEKQSIHLELGLLYLIELENEEEGMKHLEYARGSYKEAEKYISIQSYISKALLTAEEKKALWKIIDEMLNYMELEEGYLGYILIIRACEKIDSTESWIKIKELSEMIKENRQWGKSADSEENRIEILRYLMKAYKKLGDIEEAEKIEKELELLNAL